MTSNPNTIRIALVDDHPLIIAGIKAQLQTYQNLKICFTANSANEFIEQLQNYQIDIAIIDLVMPKMTGEELTVQLRKTHPEIAILVLSAESTQAILERLLQEDIHIEGFINKSSPINEIVEAIESIADGGSYFGTNISYIIDAITTANDLSNIALTNREKELIKLVGEGLLSKEIAIRMNISCRTVETHKNNIFRKLKINNSVELLRFALKNHMIKL